ncbi:myosin-11-like [Musca domestica]|uniref:Myosin-11-like n=1 Tax=Musca domestica TaxID=7370 RepID=A0A1I8M3X4_MUSDO|nr:myosin-11-like [Musca domestica]
MLSQKETSAQKTVVAVHTEGASYLKSSDRRGEEYPQEDESEEVENSVCVAEDTKGKLLAAKLEAELKDKSLKAVIRQLSDELSCAKRERLAAETGLDELAANLKAGEEKDRRILLLEADILQLKEDLLISQKASKTSKIEADELAAKLVVNINEDMMVEEVYMEDLIAEKESTLKKVDEQLAGKLETGRLEEVEDKLFASEMKTKKKSNLRRWNNKMALPKKDENLGHRKKTTQKMDSAWKCSRSPVVIPDEVGDRIYTDCMYRKQQHIKKYSTTSAGNRIVP